MLESEFGFDYFGTGDGQGAVVNVLGRVNTTESCAEVSLQEAARRALPVDAMARIISDVNIPRVLQKKGHDPAQINPIPTDISGGWAEADTEFTYRQGDEQFQAYSSMRGMLILAGVGKARPEQLIMDARRRIGELYANLLGMNMDIVLENPSLYEGSITHKAQFNGNQIYLTRNGRQYLILPRQ